ARPAPAGLPARELVAWCPARSVHRTSSADRYELASGTSGCPCSCSRPGPGARAPIPLLVVASLALDDGAPAEPSAAVAQAVPCDQCGLYARGDAELAEHARDVGLRGGLGDGEVLG